DERVVASLLGLDVREPAARERSTGERGGVRTAYEDLERVALLEGLVTVKRRVRSDADARAFGCLARAPHHALQHARGRRGSLALGRRRGCELLRRRMRARR